MRILIAAALLVAAPAFADPPGLFVGLAGSCWRAMLDNKGTTDTHCFSEAVGAKLTMDVHKVRNAAGAVVYEGVTVYRPTKQGWAYEYSNALGERMDGRAQRSGDRLEFWTKDLAAAEPDTVWLVGKDGYEVAGRRFRKVGKAGDGGL